MSKAMRQIPIAGPSITRREIDYVTDAATRCWYDQANDYHDRFEKSMAEYLGVRHAVALPSCTSAIHLSLLAVGAGPGDEVIVPDITWIASAAPIDYVRAQPVFADIDPHSWCLSVDSFRSCIGPRTKAVIAVDLYGNLPEMEAIRALAAEHEIAVIEDAAQAFGSELNGRKAGSLGDTGVFSFHGSKTITTGEGGMLVTDSDSIYQRVLFLRDHGRQPGDKRFLNLEVAFKYKMSSMQAAMGLAQLERAEEIISRKRQVFDWYADELSGTNQLSINRPPPGVSSSYWMVTAIVSPDTGIEKEEWIDRLGQRGIDCRPFFHPLSSLPAYARTSAGAAGRARNRVAYAVSPYGINLPSGLEITRDEVAYVCEAVRESM